MDTLPFELLVEIQSLLGPADLLAAAAVCQRWRAAVQTSDRQMFSRSAVTVQCCDHDDHQRLVSFGPRVNARLRRWLVDKSLTGIKSPLAVCKVQRVSRTSRLAEASQDHHHEQAYTTTVPHSTADNKVEEDNVEPVHVSFTEAGNIHHFRDRSLAVVRQDSGGWKVTVKTRDNAIEAEAVLRGMREEEEPQKFVFGEDVLVVVGDEKTWYYSYPSLELQSVDDEAVCNIKPFQQYFVRPPADSTDTLKVRVPGAGWVDFLHVAVARYCIMKLNNFYTSTRYIMTTMTLRSSFVGFYLILLDTFTRQVHTYVHVGSCASPYGEWKVDSRGNVKYVS